MRFLINGFIKNRDAFALAMFLAGIPFVYFLRDGLNLLPGNTFFAIGLIFSPLAFTLVFKDYSRFYKPNAVTFPILTWLLACMLAYCLLKDRYYLTYSIGRDLVSYGLIAMTAVAVLFMPPSAIGNSFIRWVLFLSFIGAVSLVYYVSKNPFYVVGQRASFAFAGETGGNPHINSRGAFFGIVAAVLALKYHKQVKLGLIIPVALIILFIVVLFLTQTMVAYLTTFLFILFFLVYNASMTNAVSMFRLFFTKWYVLVLMGIGIGALVYQFNKNEKLLGPAISYFEHRLENLTQSFFEDEKSVKVAETGDDSANTRIMHFTGVLERLEDAFNEGDYQYLLFGQGYKFMYIDIPHLEMLDSFGLVGFLFYSILFVRIALMCFREMRNPESMGTEFLAYILIYYLLNNFTSGQMFDHYRFATLYIACRFLKK
ncbi:MAG: hypothetical protein KF870_04550 [Leadbetterella sp.]|nr:hypothetical protein [Leadbetterella sp.]